MTRETKVGILITCSFLGMVGAVLTLRHQGHAATVADRGELPAWGEPTPLAPEPVPVQTAVVTPPPAAGPPTLSMPPQTHAAPTPKSLPGENILLASGTGETKPPMETPPASAMGTVGTATPHADPMNPPPSTPATPPTETGGAPAVGSAPVLGGSTPPPDMGGSPAPGGAPTLGGSTPPADAGGSPSTPPATETPSTPTPETPSNGGRIEMPPPPVTPTTPATPPAGAGVPVVGLQPLAPVSEPPPNVTIGPPEAARGPGAQPGVMPVRLVPTPMAADTMPEMGGAVASAGLPPVGAAPVGSTPPVTLPGSSVAKVESFDEDIYRWKPADTFANVSQQFYHHPKYEKALLLFNRNHPMAPEGVKADPPVLQANQVVFIPPAHILEKRYANMIPDLTPLPPPNAAVPVGQTPAAAPVGSVAPVGGVLPPAQPAAAAPAAQPRPYQVQAPAGEMMYRIAEQQLGNGNRWMEIRDLNPTWRPELPIPAGASLRLPAR